MDENGTMRVSFEFESSTNLDIVRNAIRVIVKEESNAQTKISADAAANAAIKSGYISVVLSLKTEMRTGVRVWRMFGTKGIGTATVYVDATTGAIVGQE